MDEIFETIGKVIIIVFTSCVAYELVIPIYYHFFGCSMYGTLRESAIAYWKHQYRVIKRFTLCEKKEELAI